MNDQDPYQRDNVPLFEALYGKNLISLGGIQAVENLFSGISVNGLKLLDVGFGLGGTDFYLAQKNPTHISGIEIYPWMVEHATENAPKEIKHLLSFTTYDENGKIPFEKDSFDLVYSKGVFNHIKEKLPLLSEIHRVLKVKGTLLIADWMFKESKVNAPGFLAQESQKSYKEVLEKAGFKEIQFKNQSEVFLGYVKAFIENLSNKKIFIEENFGKQTYQEIWGQHQTLMNEITAQNKFAVRIVAKK